MDVVGVACVCKRKASSSSSSTPPRTCHVTDAKRSFHCISRRWGFVQRCLRYTLRLLQSSWFGVCCVVSCVLVPKLLVRTLAVSTFCAEFLTRVTTSKNPILFLLLLSGVVFCTFAFMWPLAHNYTKFCKYWCMIAYVISPGSLQCSCYIKEIQVDTISLLSPLNLHCRQYQIPSDTCLICIQLCTQLVMCRAQLGSKARAQARLHQAQALINRELGLGIRLRLSSAKLRVGPGLEVGNLRPYNESY